MGLFDSLPLSTAFRQPVKADPEPEKPKKISSDISKRRYSGAAISRLSSDWVAASSSADAEIKTSLKKLRDRSRQLCRDNPYAKQAKRTTQINVIGQGIKLQCQVPALRGKKKDKKLCYAIEKCWKEWCKRDSCDVSGQKSFFMLENMLAGALPESGEVIFRLVRKKFGKSKVSLALEMIESDLLDEDYSGSVKKKGNEWRMGVEVDSWGRPVRYAFLTRHPGDYWFADPSKNEKHIFLDAKDVIHLFLPERPGQSRGVPWFASVMDDLHQMSGYETAAVIRARAGASLMGFVSSTEGELEADDVEDEQRLTDWEAGVFKYLNPGEEITVPNISSPDQQYEMFIRSKTRRFASGFGCSYETISRDFSETNYSSSRLSLLEDREHWKMLQTYLIDNFHQRVFEEFLDAAVLDGVLDLPDYELSVDRYINPKWQTRGWTWVDPRKEIEAYRMGEAAGYYTKGQIVSMLGNDLDDNIQQIKSEQDQLKESGVQLDLDLKVVDVEMEE
tara:strand:- start:1235 stop:2746 length:1512 start_codon:yes stop_codon:yes gene_type:complete